MVEALPRRVRFYHSKIDSISLASGTGYEELKKVYVILIMPFDPFGENHMIYTIRNRCEELPDMPYDDGACTIFLYTRGKLGNIPQQLRELLEYMEQTSEEKASNDELKEIHRMVDKVKKDEEVSKEYMKIYEKEQMLLRQGREDIVLELVRDGELLMETAAAKLNITQEQLKEKMGIKAAGEVIKNSGNNTNAD